MRRELLAVMLGLAAGARVKRKMHKPNGCAGELDANGGQDSTPCRPEGATADQATCVYGDHCMCKGGYVCADSKLEGECKLGTGSHNFCVLKADHDDEDGGATLGKHFKPKPPKDNDDDGEDGEEETESAACSAHEKCRHLDGDCCPSAAGTELDCCKWSADGEKDDKDGKGSKPGKGWSWKWTWGNKGGMKFDLKGKYVKTKDEGGTRENPRDKVKSLAEKLGLLEDWKKAEELYKDIKTMEDAAKKAEEVMEDMSKDEKKITKATIREKKEMVASLLREMFKHLVEEDAGKGKKQKRFKMKKGKGYFMKYFKPSSKDAEDALKDDIEVVEPSDDAVPTHVDLGNTSVYCTLEVGEVCTVTDTVNDEEVINVQRQADGTFVVTRNGIVHDCGAHNVVDTTCGWDASGGTRFLDFGSALLSASTPASSPTPSPSGANVKASVAALTVVAAACALMN